MSEEFIQSVEHLSMLDFPQLEYLHQLANSAPDGAAVECGVWNGGSLIAWEIARRGRGTVYAVDRWSGAQHQTGPNLKMQCEANFTKWQVPVTMLSTNSWDAPPLIPEPVAFCFIDANHGIHGIPHDIVVWPPKIMTGGILVFHDYKVSNPTIIVQCVVDAWFYKASGNWHELDLIGSTKAYQRIT